MSVLKQSLSRLTLKAFSDLDREQPLLDVKGTGKDGGLEVLYNPESIEESYGAHYVAQDYLSAGEPVCRYVRADPGELKLQLILDGAGSGSASVEAQLATLRALCSVGESREPPFLTVKWGDMCWLSMGGRTEFYGRALALEVAYTQFDRSGRALRATVQLTLGADSSAKASAASSGALAKATDTQGVPDDPVKSAAHGDDKDDGEAAGDTSKALVSAFFGAGSGSKLKHFELTEVDLQTMVNRLPSGQLRLVSRAQEGAYANAQLHTDLGNCKVGSEVTLKSGSKVLFAGLVVAQEMVMRMGCKELTLKLKHPLHRLTVTHRSQVFVKQTDKEIIETLFKAHGVTHFSTSGGSLTAKHEQLVQYQCSDWEFVRARLAASGVWLIPGASALSIGLPKLKAPAHTLSPEGSKSPPVVEALWTFSDAQQPTGVTLSAWDPKTQKLLAKKVGQAQKLGTGALDPAALAAPDAHDGKGAGTWVLLHGTPMTAGQQEALVNGRLLAQHALGVQARLTVQGSGDYQVGETVALKGFGKHLDGTGIVTGVTQAFRQTDSTWRTTLALGQETVREVDAPLTPGIRGLTVGVVAAYEKDEKTEYGPRVRVNVPVLDPDMKKDNVLWARWSSPYASKGSGMWFYPEPGDEVVLGFFEDNPSYPVVLGAMHNQENRAPFEPDKDNTHKGVVVLHDRKGTDQKKKLEWLYAWDKHTLTSMLSDDEGKMDRLVLDGEKGVELHSEMKDVVVSAAKKDLTLDAKEGKFTATAKLEWHASSENGPVSLKKGSNTLTLSTDALTAKAKQVGIEGSNDVTLKGGTSKLVLSAEQAEMSSQKVTIKGTVGTEIHGLQIEAKQ
ncbi:CIS tube protein [Paraburkholderia aspalathi]|uniref:CIS tube protein n=1 Tax=Paraburkholderia aspalathi TaxID=1324617 RepID=UPI0038BD3E2D